MKSTALRVPHVIRPNASGGMPQTWVVVDTETLPIRLNETQWQHTFRLGCIAEWRLARARKPESLLREDFASPSALVEWIANRPRAKERIGVVAHNLDYDAQILDFNHRLPELGYKLTRAILEPGKWVQRWQKGSRAGGNGARSLLLVDLGNFFPVPLRDLAIRVGMKKGRMPAFDDPDEQWLSYCRQDVEIELAILREWLRFRDEHDLGYFAPTMAGQVFNAFRHRFMHHQIYVHVHADVTALERASYYGGRCQEFWRGRAPRIPYTHVDTNSMYGSVMYDERFPTKQVGHYGSVSTAALGTMLQTHAAIALVRVRTDVPAFPLRRESKIVFPLGEFDTVLATPELKLAIEYGYLRSVSEVVTYEQAPIFREYADYFWKLRQRARRMNDEWTSKTAKQFLAALHGKFGQRIFTSELIALDSRQEDEIWTEYDIDDESWYEYRALAGRVERRIREINGRDTLIAIPSHVTSYARVKLWRWMIEAGLEHIMYVDTDSLIVKREGFRRIADDVNTDALGGLRVIGKTNLLYIRGPKWYRFGSENKRAGIPHNARSLEWDKFEYDKFRKMRWALAHKYSGVTIVEEVKVGAPYRKLLTQHGIGHAIIPLVIDPDV